MGRDALPLAAHAEVLADVTVGDIERCRTRHITGIGEHCIHCSAHAFRAVGGG